MAVHFGQMTPVGVICPKEWLWLILSFPSRRIHDKIQSINVKNPMTRKRMTPEEVATILLASAHGKRIREIEEKVGRSRGGVFAVIHRYPERLMKLRKQCAEEAVPTKFPNANQGGAESKTVQLTVDTQPATMSQMLDPNAIVKPTLEQCESEIRDALRTFYYEVGIALWKIKQFRLFDPPFTSFEAYCRERWRFSKTHANRQIAAVETVTVLGDEFANQLTEWELRPLTSLSKDKLKEIRRKAEARARHDQVPLSREILLSVAGPTAKTPPASKKKKTAAAKARSKAYGAAMRAVGAAESAVKTGDLKAVGAALILIRKALEQLATPT